jgi:hypothetical protein
MILRPAISKNVAVMEEEAFIVPNAITKELTEE